jgi:hypothetical protein
VVQCLAEVAADARAGRRVCAALWAIADGQIEPQTLRLAQSDAYFGLPADGMAAAAAAAVRATGGDDDARPEGLRLALELAVEQRVDDRLAVLCILSRLLSSQKQWLLSTIAAVVEGFAGIEKDEIFREVYRKVVSASVEELVIHAAQADQAQANSSAAMRELKDLLGREVVRME